MSVQLPEWYTKGTVNEDGTPRLGAIKYILEVDASNESAVIRLPGGNKPVKWDSRCKFCLSCMKSDFYPSHENSNPYCGGGGRPHCTCDYCF